MTIITMTIITMTIIAMCDISSTYHLAFVKVKLLHALAKVEKNSASDFLLFCCLLVVVVVVVVRVVVVVVVWFFGCSFVSFCCSSFINLVAGCY